MSSILLRVSAVEKSVGRVPILDRVSLAIHEGEVVGLVGPNGAGKTTLLRIIAGLMSPDGGTIERTVRFGYLPEERGLYQRQRIDRTLTYLAELKGMSSSEAHAEADAWLRRIGLETLRHRRAEQLSKGQQQKVQVASAWLGWPTLLLLDEPFSGLDPMNARFVCDLIEERSRVGGGALVSAHQLAMVEQICTSVVILAGGRVVWAGPIAEVRHEGDLDALFMQHVASPEREKS
jgi:ABC-2 type transport system ATP-binding protein